MKKYKHWLVLDRMNKSLTEATELINELVNYQKQHGSNVELYYRNSGAYEHIFSLETTQCYNDLELDCNSSGNSFYRLAQKPRNIRKGVNFEEYLKRYELS